MARVRNLADWLGDAKKRDAWVYGAVADAPVSYDRPDYSGRVVLVRECMLAMLVRATLDRADDVVRERALLRVPAHDAEPGVARPRVRFR